jgi:hypothetical protein
MRYAIAYVDGQGNERPHGGKTVTSYKDAKAEARRLNGERRIKVSGGRCCYVVVQL